MKRHLQGVEQRASPSNLTKYCAMPRKIAYQNLREIFGKQLKCHLQCAADSTMIRTRSGHEMTRQHHHVAPATKSDAPALRNFAPATKKSQM